jgi:hypothetical protein
MYWYAHIKPTAGSAGISANDLVEKLACFDCLQKTQDITWSSTDSQAWFTLTAMEIDSSDSYHSAGTLPETINFIECVGSASGNFATALEIFGRIAEVLGWEFVMEEPGDVA